MRKIKIIRVNITVLENKKRPIYNDYRPSYKNKDGSLHWCQVKLYTERPIDVGQTSGCKIEMNHSKPFDYIIGENFSLYEGEKEVAQCTVENITWDFVEDVIVDDLLPFPIYPSVLSDFKFAQVSEYEPKEEPPKEEKVPAEINLKCLLIQTKEELNELVESLKNFEFIRLDYLHIEDFDFDKSVIQIDAYLDLLNLEVYLIQVEKSDLPIDQLIAPDFFLYYVKMLKHVSKLMDYEILFDSFLNQKY